MELHIPSYYPKFRCLAGACPHTCCAWWEVPVDEASVAFYQNVPGELGAALTPPSPPTRTESPASASPAANAPF